jgi:hypothetical protein
MPLVVVDVCESCGRSKGEKHKATEPRPTMEQLEEWICDGVAEATDGCRVEPDGTCEHGHSSWLMVLGFV